VEAELARTENQMAEVEAKRNQEIERGRARLLALTEENLEMKEEMARAIALEAAQTAAANERTERVEKAMAELKNEIAMHQMENGNAQKKIETIRKDSNKTMLIERLRHDDEIRDLRLKIEQLVEVGIYAEKAEEVPEGIRVYSATPVAIARSSFDGNADDQARKSEENTL
jgi:hypothetical protein